MGEKVVGVAGGQPAEGQEWGTRVEEDTKRNGETERQRNRGRGQRTTETEMQREREAEKERQMETGGDRNDRDSGSHAPQVSRRRVTWQRHAAGARPRASTTRLWPGWIAQRRWEPRGQRRGHNKNLHRAWNRREAGADSHHPWPGGHTLRSADP